MAKRRGVGCGRGKPNLVIGEVATYAEAEVLRHVNIMTQRCDELLSQQAAWPAKLLNINTQDLLSSFSTYNKTQNSQPKCTASNLVATNLSRQIHYSYSSGFCHREQEQKYGIHQGFASQVCNCPADILDSVVDSWSFARTTRSQM